MAHKRCVRCAEKIEWKALTCRYCGSEQPAPQGSEPMGAFKAGCLWVFAIFFLLMGIIFFGPHDPVVGALYDCDEKVFMGGSEFYKLGPEERLACRQRIIDTLPDK